MLLHTDRNSSAAKSMQTEFRGTQQVLKQDVPYFQPLMGYRVTIKLREKESSCLTTSSNNVWLCRAQKELCTGSKQTK